MIKRMGLGYLLGRMEGSMREAGSMENNMEMEFIAMGREVLRKESGKKVRGSNGVMKMISINTLRFTIMRFRYYIIL